MGPPCWRRVAVPPKPDSCAEELVQDEVAHACVGSDRAHTGCVTAHPLVAVSVLVGVSDPRVLEAVGSVPRACGVKKLDSAVRAVLVMMAGVVQTARLADLSAVPAPLRFRSSARPPRRRARA